ncbi:hypothetical protein LZL87_012740 [Fusarium oxysporum]|uniref:F-box domain-containing protein n=1 Tax=Fusarium oxysporum f. sp. rapae TaxID=485398 RepID=A0A8J5NQX0_FUSOX|nr:hypothetical protein Forpe1208_v010952 [Fusarium oxysporum f. sp. rapae]KAI7771237.1 hypothetical protein LZL87_012740 [Fusarium oxysporum]
MHLQKLPQEILLEIISHMAGHDLTVLARVSKYLNRFVQPQLWTVIELHHAGVHDPGRLCLRDKPKPGQSARSLIFAERSRQGTLKAESLLKTFEPLSSGALEKGPEELKEIASRVRSLSLVLRGDFELKHWYLLQHLTNLTHLELHGRHKFLGWNYLYQENESTLLEQLDLPSAGSSKLRHVKLYGYIPRSLAAWVLKTGVNLERLELGMLEGGVEIEDPASGHIRRGEPWTPYHFYPADMMRVRNQEWLPIPRPLQSFLPSEVLEDVQGGKLELRLPRLKYLHLCQPSRGDDAIAEDMLYYWSVRTERPAHKSWRQILVASRLTLETLVLEQRIGAEEGLKWRHPELLKQPDPTGIGSEKLLHMIGKLLTQELDFPTLKSVELRGMFISADESGHPVPGSPVGDFMLSMRKNGVKCEARRGCICWFDGDLGGADWDAWKTDLENERKTRAEKRGEAVVTELNSEELLAST